MTAAAEPTSPATTLPRVSVVIPVRNDATNLRRCLDALKQSTYRDFEVIVVDDRSTDETGFVAHRRGARVIHNETSTGPAAARNRGVIEAAGGEIVFFVDADVCVHADTIEQLVATFDADLAVDAVFGSYDTTPGSPALIAQYKNLSHHFVHQQAKADAGTFWTGCGAIRRDAFVRLGGFDTGLYDRPCIEDIELGVRLKRAGGRIVLNKAMQATHLKRWTLWGVARTDVRDRGIPWTRLILRERDLPNDLNLGASQRVSALLAGLFVLATLVVAWWQPLALAVPAVAIAMVLAADAWTARYPVASWLRVLTGLVVALLVVATASTLRWLAIPLLLPLAGIVLLNLTYYGFFFRHRGPLFAAAVLPLHVLYYLYSGFALVVGTLQHMASRGATVSPEEHPADDAPLPLDKATPRPPEAA